jgi:hypothetical protein
MGKDVTTTSSRARRPAEASEWLERLRQHNTDQLQAQRDAEQRIEEALNTYVDADVSVRGVEHARDHKVASLERRIDKIWTEAQTQIEQIHQQQAMAVWRIGDAGRTTDQIAELLEISQTDARRLLSAGRIAAEIHSAAPRTDAAQPADMSPSEPHQLPAPHPQPPAATDVTLGELLETSQTDVRRSRSRWRLAGRLTRRSRPRWRLAGRLTRRSRPRWRLLRFRRPTLRRRQVHPDQ